VCLGKCSCPYFKTKDYGGFKARCKTWCTHLVALVFNMEEVMAGEEAKYEAVRVFQLRYSDVISQWWYGGAAVVLQPKMVLEWCWNGVT
jgi:predicted nucleic acid-binding Zn finger protein